ncbi:hypothetical protein DVK85_01495 [Flavobacterium arcticum]|uniref:TrwC relaxase domain-containing protein n=1 Tax=Flavobacterium arcticum TaxID=1784713 RepID=A0A345H8R6_9FLAO|nr:relaxase domain-containing protein [Flavobacterium arcticum]AXG72976.1 hypothetical protein DVK85_01495 [Flavobacterium arcticum]KAF2510360.1 relaxase domain-containing protein [Flavobacterium arcticum]
MIRITTSSNPQAAISYHKSSLQRQGEYYQENIPAYYHGKAAQQMGLYEVTTDNYRDLAHNRHPITKDKLTPLNVANRRVGWDITVLPPKSFSIMTALTNDPELEKALLEANQEMMLEAERLILAQNNTQKNRFLKKQGMLYGHPFTIPSGALWNIPTKGRKC